jgi:alkylhydroperoxidase family enzyme
MRLRLEVVVTESRRSTTTTEVKLPEELSSVEDALKMLAGALERSCQLGLDKVEVQRHHVMAAIARAAHEVVCQFCKNGLARFFHHDINYLHCSVAITIRRKL